MLNILSWFKLETLHKKVIRSSELNIRIVIIKLNRINQKTFHHKRTNLPERATRSEVRFRPASLKTVLSSARVANGEGRAVLDRSKKASNPSFLPSETGHHGPPDYITQNTNVNVHNIFWLILPYKLWSCRYVHTKSTDIWAAMARTSAQDTVLGQALSISAFILSTTSNPLAEFKFGRASFSVLNDVELSSRTDASQPYNIILHNNSKTS